MLLVGYGQASVTEFLGYRMVGGPPHFHNTTRMWRRPRGAKSLS